MNDWKESARERKKFRQAPAEKTELTHKPKKRKKYKPWLVEAYIEYTTFFGTPEPFWAIWSQFEDEEGALKYKSKEERSSGSFKYRVRHIDEPYYK